MKKLFLISLLVCVGILQSFADGFYYTDERGVKWGCADYPNSTTVSICDASGYGDEVVIPEKVYNGTKEYTVTDIRIFTFQDNKTLEKVTWPSTVTKIPSDMFQNCSSLKTVENVRKVTSISSNAFDGCNNLIELDLGSFEIYGFAFNDCSKLQSIGESAKCTSVGNGAFKYCSSLEKIDLSMCTSVSSNAFYSCSSLRSIGNPKLTSIPDNAFYGCSSLEKIDLSMCTTVGSDAFYGCSKLQNVNISNCTYIGYSAFNGCSSITEVDLSACKNLGISAFDGCKKLENVIGLENYKSIPSCAFRQTALKSVDLPVCTTIGGSAFSGCSSLQSVDLPVCTTIGYSAFYGCSGLQSVNLPKVESIGNNVFGGSGISKVSLPATLKSMGYQCFDNVKEYTFNGTQPAVLTEQLSSESYNNHPAFSGAPYIIRVPESAIDAYKAADIWKNYTDKIFSISDQLDYDVTTTAMDNQSGLEQAIGATNMKKVVSLKATGTINGYDIFMIRTKMTNLQNLDLTDADIVANSFAYYEYCHTYDNVVGSYSFYKLDNLVTLKLPKNAVTIGSYAVANCSSLESVDFPKNLKYIRDHSFKYCSNLADIYTYTVEPISIGQNTFDGNTYKSARLWMPTQSYANYYYQTQWGQFDNDNYRWFDEPYEYMYINKDYTLSDANSANKDKGRFDGNPDIDVNPGGGLIVDGDKDQTADDIHLKADASNWATIIAKANVDAKRIFIDITIEANRWHFFCFPFDIKRSNIKCDGNFVFRYYDGKVRAEKGKGGWTDLPATEEYLKAGKGYIFQASASCTLSIMIEKEKFGKLPNVKFDCNLEANASTNEQDASWNFVGNPFTSFFDLNDMGYNAPVTRWNGSSYEAVRPGDDDYIFHPYEAFFVQRPTGSSTIEFDPEHRMTQIGSNNRKTENAKKAMKRQLNPERLLVNLAVSDGKNTDKTRVVFNQTKSNKYEMDCDAAKFESTTSAVQLYSIEAQGGKMAINERPQGSVQLGFTAKADGDYTISAERMDQPVLLKDNLMNITYDLSNGDYSFSSEAGTFDNRFMLLIDGGATGIADIAKEAGVNIMPSVNGINLTGVDGKTVNVYSLSGALFATRTENGFLNLSKGVYIVEVGKMKAKVMVK